MPFPAGIYVHFIERGARLAACGANLDEMPPGLVGSTNAREVMCPACRATEVYLAQSMEQALDHPVRYIHYNARLSQYTACGLNCVLGVIASVNDTDTLTCPVCLNLAVYHYSDAPGRVACGSKIADLRSPGLIADTLAMVTCQFCLESESYKAQSMEEALNKPGAP